MVFTFIALSLLSEVGGRPLGAFGDYAVFCLYKTLPVPNGALLVANGSNLDPMDRIDLRPAGSPSVLGRMAELMTTRLHTRLNGVGAVLHAAKRGVGRVVGALRIQSGRSAAWSWK